MDSEFNTDGQMPEETGLSRRDLLKRAGVVAAAGAAAYPALAPGLASASARASAAAKGGALTPAQAAIIKQYFPIQKKYAGAGETWKIGGAFPFTSIFSVYGTVFVNGVKLAIPQIHQLGGPKIVVDYRDIGLDDPVKSRDAFVAWGSQKVPFVISSLEVGGYIVPSILKSEKILSMDPGGGNGGPGSSLPYFWGMNAPWGYDSVQIGATYLAKKKGLKRAIILMASADTAQTAPYINAAKAAIQHAGGTVVATILPSATETDFTDTFTQIRAAGGFDYISCGISGLTMGLFLKQYKTSGINKPMWCWESMLAPTVAAAGGEAPFEGVYLGGVNAYSPRSKNPWAQVFTSTYLKTFGNGGYPKASPSYDSALYYESMFVMWKVYSEVKRRGGNVNSGTDLQAALAAHPSFPTVFGGGAGKVGTMTFDTTTHGLKNQPIGFYKVINGNMVELATNDASSLYNISYNKF